MKVRVERLRRVIKEEFARLVEAPKPTVVMATIPQADVPKWDEAVKALKVKSFIKFVPAENGDDVDDVVYQGYGTPGAAKKQADSMAKKIQKAMGKTAVTEQPVDDKKVYDLLTFAFTSTVGPEGVQYIRYMPMKNAVRMVDYDGMLGNMDAGGRASDLARYGLTPRQLGDWLAAHSALPMKQQKRPQPAPSIYD